MGTLPIVLYQIGFWFDPWSGGPDGPGPGVDPSKLIDTGWAAAEQQLIVQYLRSGRTYGTYRGHSFCRLQEVCGVRNEEMGARTLTDWVWAWPEGLWHYVAVHQICLPDEFLNHARQNGYIVPVTNDWNEDDVPTLSSEKWDQWAQSKGAYHT